MSSYSKPTMTFLLHDLFRVKKRLLAVDSYEPSYITCCGLISDDLWQTVYGSCAALCFYTHLSSYFLRPLDQHLDIFLTETFFFHNTYTFFIRNFSHSKDFFFPQLLEMFTETFFTTLGNFYTGIFFTTLRKAFVL